MEILKYKVISTKAQYIDYCKKLETLVFSQVKNKNLNDEIALLSYQTWIWQKKYETNVLLTGVTFYS